MRGPAAPKDPVEKRPCLYVVNATKGSQTNIRTALWALSTIIFLIVVIVEVVMNFAPIKNEAQKEKH